MDDHEIILRIQELLDGVEWTPDTAGEIAKLLTDNGYRVRDLDDKDVEDSPAVVRQGVDEEGKCMRCGAGGATFEPDPYDSEMNGDDTPVWMCEECRQEVAQDI